MKGVRHLDSSDVTNGWLDPIEGATFGSQVKVVHLKLSAMSRGLRPLGIPDQAYRVRVGVDTSIADLVCALSAQTTYSCICFDFGGTY